MTAIARRDLFRAAGHAAIATPALSYSRILGANDRLGLGVIGCGGRGRHIMKVFQSTGQVDVRALCDVYGARIDQARSDAAQAQDFYDHRRLLEVKSVDAVLIATPDHWHAGTTIDALRAGKDVYVEKPLTLKIEEGPAIVRAARVNERVCQVGMQQRSGMHYWKAKTEYIDTGRLGKITVIHTIWHSGVEGSGRGRAFPREKPSNLDWARYLGPVKWREWDPPQYFAYRRYLDFGGGKITDFFAHWGDVVHMFMGQDDPVSAVAAGGIYHHQDGRTAPDTIYMLLEYRGGFTVTFESATGAKLPPYGIHVCGTGGRLFIDRGRYEFHPPDKDAPPEIFRTTESLDRAHVENFLECCRSRKRPNGDVYFGHRGAMAAHLGNIAYIEKRRIKFDPDREEILPR
jgi:predicted dehydrogenase